MASIARLRNTRILCAALLALWVLAAPVQAAAPPEPPPVGETSDVRALPAPPVGIPEPHAIPSKDAVVRAIVGLSFLLALAFVASHPRVVAFERSLALNPIVSSGLVFIFLGTLAARSEVGILPDFVLRAIAPVVPLGLGWIGFRTGFRCDRDLLAHPPAQGLLGLAVLFPVAMTVAGAYAAIHFLKPEIVSSPATLRDALLLGVAAAMSSTESVEKSARRLLPSRYWKPVMDLAKAEHVIGVLALLLLSLYFRPQGSAVSWQLPATGWLFVGVGMGCLLGTMTYALLRISNQGPQFIVIVLGSLCMSAGLASYLRLSPMGVCFVAGLVLTLLPGVWKPQVGDVLDRMERPVYFVLLVITGALWLPLEWRLWILACVFIVARAAGKQLALRIGGWRRIIDLPAEARFVLAYEPVGAFAVAVIITGRDLYPDGSTPGLLTSVIVAAVVNEIIAQVWLRRKSGSLVNGPTAGQESGA